MQILVTGGAGFIGSHVVRALVSRPDVTQVRVVDNLSHGRLARLEDCLSSPKYRFIQAHVEDAAAMMEAVQGVSLIFHLAAESNVMRAAQHPQRCFASNVMGTYTLLNAALEAGVKRVIFASSREVYGEPTELPVSEDFPLIPKNEYGASKITGEVYGNLYRERLELGILRFANVYGAGDEGRVIPIFMRRALAGEAVTLYGGEQIIDFVWIGHAIEALLRMGFDAEMPRVPINIASGRGTSLHELVLMIREVTGSAIPIHIQAPRQVEVMRFVGDATRMKALLGIDAADDMRPHLAEMIASYQPIL